jgi:hypothetical protein
MTPEQRIDELERQNRRFRRTGMTALMIAFAIVAGLLATSCTADKDAAQPKVVTGTEFRLVDDKGVARAVLAMESGEPVLRFLSEQGKPRAMIGLGQFGPLLSFVRENGRPGTSLGVSRSVSSMAFGDSAGHPRIMLVVDSTGAPKVMLRDTTGRTAWTAP